MESIDEKRKRDFQKKRRIARRKERKKRRMIFYTICIVLILIILRAISGIIHKHKKVEAWAMDYPKWMLMQILREKDGHPDNSDAPHYTMEEKYFIAYDKATGMKKRLVKNSNHITAAKKYAYDTEIVRQYIRGEKVYEGKDKLVFLTFDDGPNTSVTPQILKILSENDVHGTFFVVGKSVTENHYNILKQIISEGNSIAVHSFSHDYHTLYPGKIANPAKILEEARLTEKRLEKCFGEDFKSNVFRYPGGHMSWNNIHDADEVLSKDGYIWIDWNCLNGDAERKSVRPVNTEEQIKYIDKTLHKNLHSDVAVVLMHDASNKQLTVNSLNSIIKYFKDNDYKFCILK